MSDEPTFDGITAAAVENLLQLTRWTNSAADVLGCTSPKLTTYTVPSKRKLEQIAKAVGRKPHILTYLDSEVCTVSYYDIEFQHFTGRCS